eukprot:858648-Pleurochrysis_carterae.AAC.1
MSRIARSVSVEIAEAREHGEFHIEQGSRAFADDPNCVSELVGHQAVREPLRGGQRSVQSIELL